MRSWEGSPLIPGLIWRFCSPSGFCLCHWQLQPSCAHTCRCCETVRSEALLASKQLQALALRYVRESSRADSLQSAATAVNR